VVYGCSYQEAVPSGISGREDSPLPVDRLQGIAMGSRDKAMPSVA